MNKKIWLVTGDTHGDFSRFSSLEKKENVNIIILGDVGLNFYLRKKDFWNKTHLCEKFPFTFYCVRGNHEARPQDIAGMTLQYDPEVEGKVWVEETFPRIKYFQDWGIYTIDGHKTLVVGGAYSVDKEYRLKNGWSWFANEQLTESEMNQCMEHVKGQSFDLVLTHTCPFSWRPTDLFLSCVNQQKVDTTMEKWMEELKYAIHWNIWMFGHFHQNRYERPHVEMLFTDISYLNEIFQTWKDFDETKHLDWWAQKGPNFYMEDVWKA